MISGDQSSRFSVHFRFAPWIEDRTMFIVYCFAARIFLALGVSAAATAIFVIVTMVWPENVAYILVSFDINLC